MSTTDSITLSLLSIIISFPIILGSLYFSKPQFVTTPKTEKDGTITHVLSINKILLWSILFSLFIGLIIALIERYKEEQQIHQFLLKNKKQPYQSSQVVKYSMHSKSPKYSMHRMHSKSPKYSMCSSCVF